MKSSREIQLPAHITVDRKQLEILSNFLHVHNTEHPVRLTVRRTTFMVFADLFDAAGAPRFSVGLSLDASPALFGFFRDYLVQRGERLSWSTWDITVRLPADVGDKPFQIAALHAIFYSNGHFRILDTTSFLAQLISDRGLTIDRIRRLCEMARKTPHAPSEELLAAACA